MLTFKHLLEAAGLDPNGVKLLRHKAPVDLLLTWLNDRAAFENLQSLQEIGRRKEFSRPYWASFIALQDGRTLFVGVYKAARAGLVSEPFYEPLTGSSHGPDTFDRYDFELTPLLAEYRGRLFIEWGAGKLAWAQNAENHDKPIVELTSGIVDPPWPGFMGLVMPLSELAVIPQSWRDRLAEAKGVYLLACPEEGKAYVGKADGANGLLGRWEEYARNGHGGNKLLRDRERTDLQVSILEVARLGAEGEEIDAMESLWKRKLMSRIMGLNAN